MFKYLHCLIFSLALLTLLVACDSPAMPTIPPTLTRQPTRAPSPTPRPTPTPTPTATPIPPATLLIQWPGPVSALKPVPIQVKLVPPSGVGITATISAQVYAPASPEEANASAPLEWGRYGLKPQGRNSYSADEPLRLPLEPVAGEWRLVVNVRSSLQVRGTRELVFEPVPIRFRDLGSSLPAGAHMRVPEDFREVIAEGDQWAGRRVWRYEQGEVGLWWAPGPVEPLQLGVALEMLAALTPPEKPALLQSFESADWQGHKGFMFYQDWSEEQFSGESGPGQVLVVQGDDYWLYALRARAIGSDAIPPLALQVWRTFTK